MTQSGCCPEQATSWLSWQRANGVIVALALLVLGLLPGCAKSAIARHMPPGFVSCQGVTRTPGWCRSLTVPTDWANPSGPTTALWVNVLPATGSRARSDVLSRGRTRRGRDARGLVGIVDVQTDR